MPRPPDRLPDMPAVAACLACGFWLATHTAELAAPPGDDVQAIRHEAFTAAYNLDQRQALDILARAIAQHPDEPSLHRSLAAVTWLTILFQRGAVTVDYFSGGLTARVEIEKPPPELDLRFRAAVERAIALAEARLGRAPSDPEAHYELGAAVGLRATYVATVEGGVLSAIRTARRAFDEHERVLALDPRRKDAGLIVGTYRYIVGSLSAPLRLMAYIVGFGGGHERGLRMIEDASAYPSDAQPEAQFALLLLYNREKRYTDALRVASALEARYPRNRLLLLEEGSTSLRAGDAAGAASVLDRGLDALRLETRPLAPGEWALWYHKRGAARLRLGRVDEAAEDQRAAQQNEAPAWVRGRVQLELGKVADLKGDRAAAVARYRDAARLCGTSRDEACADEAKRLSRTGYRRE